MSVVACRITKSGYEISSDSIVVSGHTQTRGQTSSFVKLYETNGMVIGSVGLAEEGSLFRLFCETHRPSRSDEFAILELIAEFSEWKNKKLDNAGIENEYILGYEKNVFCISRWHVEKIKTYCAIGAGMDFALAALYLGHSARKAVETAIELSIYCESPIVTIDKNVQS